MVYLVWAVFGGFLLHIILCNYLTILLKPRKEDPIVDFTKDIIKRNITPYGLYGWGLGSYDHFKDTSLFGPEYQELLQKLKVSKREERIEMIGRVFNLSKSEAWLGSGANERLWLINRNIDGRFRQFWISKESVPHSDSPYAFYLTYKKWPLLEVLSLYLNIK